MRPVVRSDRQDHCGSSAGPPAGDGGRAAVRQGGGGAEDGPGGRVRGPHRAKDEEEGEDSSLRRGAVRHLESVRGPYKDKDEEEG